MEHTNENEELIRLTGLVEQLKNKVEDLSSRLSETLEEIDYIHKSRNDYGDWD